MVLQDECNGYFGSTSKSKDKGFPVDRLQGKIKTFEYIYKRDFCIR